MGYIVQLNMIESEKLDLVQELSFHCEKEKNSY